MFKNILIFLTLLKKSVICKTTLIPFFTCILIDEKYTTMFGRNKLNDVELKNINVENPGNRVHEQTWIQPETFHFKYIYFKTYLFKTLNLKFRLSWFSYHLRLQ